MMEEESGAHSSSWTRAFYHRGTCVLRERGLKGLNSLLREQSARSAKNGRPSYALCHGTIINERNYYE